METTLTYAEVRAAARAADLHRLTAIESLMVAHPAMDRRNIEEAVEDYLDEIAITDDDDED